MLMLHQPSRSFCSLSRLRLLMKDKALDGVLVPNNDPHNSEYLPKEYQVIRELSSFSGSNAFCLVTQDQAFLWTDPRYYLQAQQQLDTHWTMKKIEAGQPKWPDFLASLNNLNRIGYSPLLMSQSQVEELQRKAQANGQTLVPDSLLLPSLSSTPPSPSSSPIYRIHEKYVGRSTLDKLQEVVSKVREECGPGVDKYLISSLEQIAWLLNLRGNYVQHNLLFKSYLVVNTSESGPKAVVFLDPSEVGQEVRDYLGENQIQVEDYQGMEEYLKEVQGQHIVLSKGICNNLVYQSVEKNNRVTSLKEDIVQHMQSIKNGTELGNVEEANRLDGSNLVRLMHWLRNRHLENTPTSEWQLSDTLTSLRAESPLFLQESFPSIVGSGPNSAIIHYDCKQAHEQNINYSAPLLLDSGGHFLTGTTDITRTFQIDRKPTQTLKQHYTRVLKGNLQLQQQHFPPNTQGCHLDILARQFLYEVGLDYGHGTGHGIGYGTVVHEPPVSISKMSRVVLQKGMLLSNEPGFYLPGHFGIRIENNLEVVQSSVNPSFLAFRNHTLVPYDRWLIDKHMLTPHEVHLIDTYHHSVLHALTPLLPPHHHPFLHQITAPL